MGDSINPDDFIAAAMRQSRTALADDGFSQRVEQQVKRWQKRQWLARAVRTVCAIGTIFIAGLATSVAAVYATRFLMKLGQSLDLAALHGHALLSGLIPGGLPPWALAFAGAAIIIGIAIHAADRDPPLRF